jgi:3-dehydroquinate dehydratase-2
VESLCRETAKKLGFEVEFRQSNKEGELIDFIHEAAKKKAAGIVINPAGYTTTSIAIMDAILSVKVPTVEVHISNIHARESFRHNSYISRAARGVICGLGIEGYALAISGLAGLVKKK